MFNMLTNLAKAVVAVAVTPIDLIVDVVTLPASALNDEGPFDRTADRLKQVGEALDKAITPTDE